MPKLANNKQNIKNYNKELCYGRCDNRRYSRVNI